MVSDIVYTYNTRTRTIKTTTRRAETEAALEDGFMDTVFRVGGKNNAGSLIAARYPIDETLDFQHEYFRTLGEFSHFVVEQEKEREALGL